MNKAQRKALTEVLAKIGKIDLESIGQTITDLQAEEQDKYDNMPENLQGSDKGEAIQAAADALQTALDAVEEARTALDEAFAALEEAQA